MTSTQIKRRTLVIGLGGTGCLTLRFAKQRLQEYGALSQDLDSLPVRFVPVDLDEGSRLAQIGAKIDDEFVQTRGSLVAQKVTYIDRPENSLYWEWYADKDREVIKLRQAQVGAGQWRPLGRMAYCENQNLIETAIRDSLRELESLRFAGEEGIDVILVSSLAGGTGSGCLLDVSYFLQSRGLGAMNGYLPTAAFLLLPRVFEASDVGHRTAANSYAALKELACFYQQKRDFEIHYPLRPERFRAPAGTIIPFSNLFLFDCRLPDRILAEPEECFEYMGNMIFLRMVTEVKALSRSVFSNEKYPPRRRDDATTLREGGFLFSGCSGALFILPTEEAVATELFTTIQREVAEDLQKTFEDGEPGAEPLEGWRQQLRDEVVFAPDLLDSARMTKTIADLLKPSIKAARETIQAERMAGLADAFSRIINFDWVEEIRKNLDEEVEGFQRKLGDKLSEKMVSSARKDELQLTTFARRIRSARALLEEKGKGLEYPGQEPSPNPLVASRQRIAEVLEDLLEIVELGLPGLPPEQDESPHALFAPLSARKFRKRGFAEASEALSTFEKVLSGPELESHLGWHCQTSLKTTLERLIETLKQDEGILRGWVEAFIAEIVDQEGPLQKREVQGEKMRETVSRKPLNIASIPASDVVKGLTANRSELRREFEKEALRAVRQSSSPGGSLAHPRMIEELVRELLAGLRQTIAEAVRKQTLAMSPEAFDDVLAEIMENAKIVLFENYITNPCQESKVFYFRPSEARFFWKNDERKALDSRVKQKIRQVFQGAQTEVGDSRGSYIAVYHETHYHPAANIASIVELHEAYQSVPFPTACLHIHRDYAVLDNLLGETSVHEVRCGNPKCDFNISKVPRDVYFCPNCDNPILNRCGNPSCNVDNLLEKLGGPEGLNEKRIMCPACNQKIVSFWWYCESHGSQWREKHERYCLKCNEAVVGEAMDFSDKSLQNKGHRWEVFCIHCKREKISVAPFKIPLPELYFDVPKHRVPLLLTTLEQVGLEGNLCPTCGSDLFPECPHGNGHRHFVIRGPGGRLACNNYDAHGETMVLLFQCFHCDYPLKGEEKECPRCRHQLLKCPNCTEDKGYLIPKSLWGHERRCPACGYEIENAAQYIYEVENVSR